VLAMLVILASVMVYFSTQARLNKKYDIPAESVPLPTDADSIAYGKRIFQFRGCEACHGEKLEGKVYLSDPVIGSVNASNLTSGLGGVAESYDDQAWVLSIRHGIRPDGSPLLFMPSVEFYFLSDEDLGAAIAYIKSMPPADHEIAKSVLSPTGRLVMTLVKTITFIPSELIPHDAPRPAAPQTGITPEYGEYLTYSCKVCHGLTMSGGEIPGFPDTYPPAANLTPSEDRYLPYWTEQDFVKVIRTGLTRHNRQVDPAYMPWTSYKHMTDDELKAVWAYLNSLPPVPFGNR
jgi:mono/diheme cytochrome c family protein